MGQWDVPGNVSDNFERSEMVRTLPVDITGAWCQVPGDLRRALDRSEGHVVFRVEPTGISLKVGKPVSLVWSRCGDQGQWQWLYHPPLVAIPHDADPVTVGPTLVYGKDRQPKSVKPTDQQQVNRIARAWQTIKLAWPEGHTVLTLLTSRIIPLRAKGVVSFSYRHRPGLSFINSFDRDNLDLIDDLIHENSHHHLNLLLRKHIMYHRDHNQQIFYSPWRRSLRPLRGILHATFTFTMGALLFERLSSWASGRRGSANWKAMGLTQQDLRRARFRCLEEVESVRYSLQDLHYADHHLKWLTGSGRRLVGQLTEILDHVDRSSAQFRQELLRSSFGPLLRKQTRELQAARQTYGPMRLGSV
jgi:HEXXH motif-containing protein